MAKEKPNNTPPKPERPSNPIKEGRENVKLPPLKNPPPPPPPKKSS